MLSALGADAGSFSVPRGEADDFLIKAEKAPNASGARALGFRESDEPLGSANLAIVLGHATGADAFSAVDKLILLDTHESVLEERADVVLPTRSFAEVEGTFTNHANRVQRFLPILEPTFEAWSYGEALQRLAAEIGLEGFQQGYSVREVSKRLSETVPAFSGIHLDSLDDQGRELG
jgi:predicted molibdopterin-dependent oxidoreductase YjgC